MAYTVIHFASAATKMGLSLLSTTSPCLLFLLLLLSSTCFTTTDAFEPHDPNGNITIKWDIITWTPDGYVAVVTMINFQQYRHVAAPGWSLGWTWAKKEVIWSMMGARTTEQGDCTKFKSAPIPHCCKKNPTVVDLLPGTPYNQRIANCCKGGVLSAWGQDPTNAVASFQVSVGIAGTTNRTTKIPRNFTLKAPGLGYTCGPAKIVKPTKFITPDKRRMTQALMTWNVICSYSQFLAQKTHTCCGSPDAYPRLPNAGSRQPDAYPRLPNAGSRHKVSLLALVMSSLVVLIFYAHA